MVMGAMWLRSRCWSVIRALSFLAFGAGVFPPLASPALAQLPRLVFDGITNDVFHLTMPDLDSGNANLEGSLDLRDWFTLQSATARAGAVHFAFTNHQSASAWFFRGVVAPAPIPIRIVAQVDTNLTAGFLLTPGAGGGLTLRDSQGIKYEFTASSNLVHEPVAIQMTVITNFLEFPEYDGFRAAVRFSPEGFAFLGEAQLRITFPNTLPPEEMLGYSFQDDGTGFHLIQSDPGSNEIVMGISRFSGKGVARFSEGRVPSFDQAWDSAKSGIRAAEHRAALLDRKALRELYINETITEADYQRRTKENRLRKLEDIYRNSVKPFERAAATDCAIGQAVVLGELERLASLWAAEEGKNYRESPYYPKLVEISPKVRCVCAHRLIERCEKEPNVSGGALLNGLDHVLLRSLIYTHRTDAQGCDLGSDDQIRDRLVSSPCFGAWEGTVTLSRIQTKTGTATSLEGIRTETYDNETKEIFTADITRILDQDIFIDNDGKLREFWTMRLSGPYSIGFRLHEIIAYDFGDIVVTATESAQAADSPMATGQTTLSLVDGEFDGLGPGGGIAPTQYRLPIVYSTETTYQCKTPRPPNNPCPPTDSSRQNSSLSIFQGYFVGPKDPKMVITITPKDLKLSWTRTRESPQLPGPPILIEEEIVVNLRRAPRR
jgi:cold shock CspA family protein